jgi:hypothetical protein
MSTAVDAATIKHGREIVTPPPIKQAEACDTRLIMGADAEKATSRSTKEGQQRIRHPIAQPVSAANDAMSLAADLDNALYGLAKDLTPADLNAADQEPLEVARDNLRDLLDQVLEALTTVERILELRADPDAEWPA